MPRSGSNNISTYRVLPRVPFGVFNNMSNARFPFRRSLIALSIAVAAVFLFGVARAGLRASIAANELTVKTSMADWDISRPANPMTVNSCEPVSIGNIEVEGSGGTGVQPTGYPTLGAAFIAINSGVHTGAIAIDVCGNTTEAAASSVLNANGSVPASYSSIIIRPVGGAARTITAATTAGSPMIDFNGADFVTINGLNTGGNSLTISNTTAAATSNTSTIRFIADATNNTLTNLTILGSSTMPTTTSGGTIYFAAGSTTTGNDNNTVSNSNIGPAGINLPTKAVYSSGSTASTNLYNSGIVFSGNNIFDFFNSSSQSNGFYIGGGSTDWSISANRFFQTVARTQTAGVVHAPIQIANGNVNNCIITNNIIGFANSSGSGTYDFAGIASSRFFPIYLSAHGTATATSIQGNTINNISVAGPVSGTGTSAPFASILVAAGLASIGNVTGNIIGSNSSISAISVNSSAPMAADVYGVYYNVSTSPNISNNSIGGITVTNSNASPNAVDFYGIRVQTNSTSTNTIQNNTVGYSAGPITNNSTNSGSNTYGIYSQSGAQIVTGNIISNLTMVAGSSATGNAATMIGLWIDNNGSGVDNDISRNTVRFLTNNDATANDSVQGILYSGDPNGTHLVARNLVYSISVPNAAIGTVNGIFVQTGTTTFQNNMIALGNGLANGESINGINEVSGINNFFHNSVYIGGSAVGGGANTFALTSALTSLTRAYRDNIFFNARSNGVGTGKHYSIQVGGTGVNPGGLTTNNNVLFANGTGGNTGRYNGADRLTLANWQTATGQDANSFSSDPQFIGPANATPNLHISPFSPTVVETGGADVGVGDDFDGQTRSGLTPVDIGADAGNFTAFVIDTVPPDTTITSGPSGTVSSTSATFTFTSTEAGSTFQCSLDGAAFASCINPVTLTGLSQGSRTFQVRATDPAGNTDAAPASRTWMVDTVAPDTAINTMPANPTNDTTGDFTFSSNEAGPTFECSVDGAAFAACNSPIATAALANGSHTFAVRATDAAGNPDASPASFTWTLDTTPPVITYTPLGNTTSTANRVLSVTVTDNVAVASGSSRPGILTRKNGGALPPCGQAGGKAGTWAFAECGRPNGIAGGYSFSQCAQTGGNSQNGTYDCTIDFSFRGGVTAGDVIGYAVIVSDAAGNDASNPVGFEGANINNLPPPTPNTYTILPTFAGAVSVGTGETISSLTNPGGLFEQMNAGTIDGNVIVNITSDLTAETGTTSLNQQVETGAGNWTISFQASGSPRLISGSNATALINLNGADRITFNGLAFGGNSLTFRNTGNGQTIQLINDASNNSIVSCIVESGSSGIFFGAGAVTGNDNNSVSDGVIRARTVSPAVPVYSIRSDGSPTIIRNSNLIIQNNTFTDYTAAGVSLVDTDNFIVSNNTFSQTAPRSNVVAIEADRSGGSNLVERNTITNHTSSGAFGGIYFGEVGNATISRNRVYGIDGQTTVLGAFVGIWFAGSAVNPSSVLIQNNMISIAPSIPTSQDIVGLFDQAAAGNSLDAQNNTFLVGGTSTSPQISYGFLRASSSPSNVSLTNNLFFNSRTGGGANHLAISDSSPNQGSWSSNYNLFVGSGNAPANFFEYGGIPVDFATWKAGPPTRDANSLASVAGAGPFNVANMFVSANDLHLNIGGNNPAINAGTNSGLTTDFDGQMRPFNGLPDIGADEVQTVPTAADVSLGGRVSNANGQGIRNIRVVITGGNLSEPRTALTSSFGYFSFDGLGAGETYVVTVAGKRYVFINSTRIVTLNDAVADIDFVAVW